MQAFTWCLLEAKEKKEKQPRQQILDIGQTGDASKRLDYHDREECWKGKKPQSDILFFKFAPMSSETYDEIDRRIVETDS